MKGPWVDAYRTALGASSGHAREEILAALKSYLAA
jgi:hypothetical protein